MLIGVFGGSFNPIHVGHLAVARAMLAAGCVQQVWLMVSPQNPLKPAAGLLAEEHRYAMARLACAAEPGVVASRFEFDLPRPSYTWATLQALAARYPEHRFALIIGADNWLLFDRWRCAAGILASHAVFVYPRRGFEVGAASLPAGVRLVDCPQVPISSTALRRDLAAGRDVSRWIPAPALAYIRSHGLYQA